MDKFLRPKKIILDNAALVPEKNLLYPPPNLFSHRLKTAQPFYFDEAKEGVSPVGHLQQGSKVLLVRSTEGKADGWVITEQGLYVFIRMESLEKLP